MAWVDDRTVRLVREMHTITEELSARGAFHSSLHATALLDAKAQALREFRDQEWKARMRLASRARQPPDHADRLHPKPPVRARLGRSQQ